MTMTEKHIIYFDHHSAELRDHNTELLHRLMGTGYPLGWSEEHGGFWAIWGYDALYDAVQNPDLFSSGHSLELPKGVPSNPNASPLIPIDIDGPIQQEYRKMVLNWFNPGHARSMEPRIQQLCTDLIDAFIERGEADLAQELFTALPARVTLEMLDWESDRWEEWIGWIHSFIHDTVTHPEKAAAGVQSLYANIDKEIAKRRETLGQDLFSDMMASEINGEHLSDEQIRDFALLVMLGGMDTTAGVTGNTILELDRDPALRQRLIDEMDHIPKAIEEFLRFDGPGGGLYRRVTEDVEFHGQPMKKGDRVLMMYWAANRDPAMFPDAETIDIHRTRNRHMAFGLGPHRCLGSHHARLMFGTMLRELLTRLPDFKVDRDRVRRFEDCGGVYAVRYLPVTFTPGKRSVSPG
jgi:cytochrome P450